MNGLTIGDVAKRANVRIETLRYYEREGLVASPPRSLSNYRLYPEDTVHRVQFIKRVQELGFSLKEIKELLSLRMEPSTSCADVRNRALEKITTISNSSPPVLIVTMILFGCMVPRSKGRCPLPDVYRVIAQ